LYGYIIELDSFLKHFLFMKNGFKE